MRKPPYHSRPSITSESIGLVVEGHLRERHAEILPEGDRAKNGHHFEWCGEVLDFLVDGLTERLARLGITFTTPYPGPFRLWDEEQASSGDHVRRFWTVALHRGCPIAKLCTIFFHRHDTPAIPRPPQVVSFPPDYRGDEPAEES